MFSAIFSNIFIFFLFLTNFFDETTYEIRAAEKYQKVSERFFQNFGGYFRCENAAQNRKRQRRQNNEKDTFLYDVSVFCVDDKSKRAHRNERQ